MSRVHKFFEISVEEKKPYIIQSTMDLHISHFPPKESKVDLVESIDEHMIIANAQAEADKIIANAQVKAEEILLSATKEGEKTLQSAYEKGYQAGVAEGKQNITEQEYHIIEQAKDILLHTKSQKERILSGLEGEILGIAFDIAEKIVSTELDRNDQAFVHIVKNAIAKVVNEKRIILRVSAFDYSCINSAKEYLLSQSEGIMEIEIKQDRFLDKGSCIIEAGNTAIDSSLQTQLKQIETAFRSVIGNEK